MEMIIRQIRDEADYDAALAEADSLTDSIPGSEAGDRLDSLVSAIEAYEAHHWPIGTGPCGPPRCHPEARPR
jgi:HTH-type transcriptional regulator/antitoxin HigA